MELGAGRTTLGKPDIASLKGKPSTEFLSTIHLLHPTIVRLRFAEYVPEPKLSERLENALTQEELELRDQATSICHGNGIPFWDVLLGICIKGSTIPERFLESAGIHGSKLPTSHYDLHPSEVSTQRIRELIAGLAEGRGLVVSSKVTLGSGETAHLPMLDFRCPCSPSNARAVRKIMQLLGETRGILVESGRSYHYYGIKLRSDSEWTQFMARALLFAPIVDPRYVAHRLADGECRLKLVSSKEDNITEIVDAYTD